MEQSLATLEDTAAQLLNTIKTYRTSSAEARNQAKAQALAKMTNSDTVSLTKLFGLDASNNESLQKSAEKAPAFIVSTALQIEQLQTKLRKDLETAVLFSRAETDQQKIINEIITPRRGFSSDEIESLQKLIKETFRVVGNGKWSFAGLTWRFESSLDSFSPSAAACRDVGGAEYQSIHVLIPSSLSSSGNRNNKNTATRRPRSVEKLGRLDPSIDADFDDWVENGKEILSFTIERGYDSIENFVNFRNDVVKEVCAVINTTNKLETKKALSEAAVARFVAYVLLNDPNYYFAENFDFEKAFPN